MCTNIGWDATRPTHHARRGSVQVSIPRTWTYSDQASNSATCSLSLSHLYIKKPFVWQVIAVLRSCCKPWECFPLFRAGWLGMVGKEGVGRVREARLWDESLGKERVGLATLRSLFRVGEITSFSCSHTAKSIFVRASLLFPLHVLFETDILCMLYILKEATKHNEYRCLGL